MFVLVLGVTNVIYDSKIKTDHRPDTFKRPRTEIKVGTIIAEDDFVVVKELSPKLC